MRFSPVILQAYDSAFKDGKFNEFFESLISDGNEFPLSGLADLKQALLMTEEYMLAISPRLGFLEKEPQDPGIFRDGSGNPTKYSREVPVPCAVKESERKMLWKDGQSYWEQPFYIWVSTMSLARLDYYPAAGDLFKWRDTWRQVSVVKVDPSDYFGTTAFPLYYKIESSLWVPELGLDGTLKCGPAASPAIMVSSRSSKLMPIADFEDDSITATL